jgi:carbon-monoxide dehydrogenase medium subunit
VKPAAFEYHAPRSLEEALGLLSSLGDEARVLAGGQSLVPMLSMRLAVFGHLVDIGRLPELRGMSSVNGSVYVGAGTRQVDIERSPAVPLLARATPLIGHFQIRNRGTLGGSLAHADPAAEYPAVAVALDASLHARSNAGERSIPARQFFTGHWSTVLGPDEILVGASFPVWPGRSGFAVEEFARRHGDFAIAGAAAGVAIDDAGLIQRCAIGMFGLGPTPLRATKSEQSLLGQPCSGAGLTDAGRAAVDDLEDVPADLHGSAEYRRRVGAAMVERALGRALAGASQGGE